MRDGTWTAAAIATIAVGCFASIDPGPDASPVGDGAVPADGGAIEPPDGGPPPPATRDVDLLLVIDNSSSMTEEQVSFATALEAIVTTLATGDYDQDGDLAGDGEPGDPDFEPVRSLQVGVVTTDLGTGGFRVPTCVRSDFGDDGLLRTAGPSETPGCAPAYPPFLTWRPPSAPSDSARDAACVAHVGTGGCGFEQQLEAALKALSPAAPTAWTALGFAPPRFHEGTAGHGADANEGLVRAGSVLAVALLTDEEDCSASDPVLYDVTSETYSGPPLSLRCFSFPEALHPVSRFVDGLLQLRHRPGRLVFVPIAGVPADLMPTPGAPIAWERLTGPTGVRDERLEPRVDPDSPTRQIPSCRSSDRGVAMPPVRILQAAEALEARGARVAVGSVCQDDHAGPLLRAIVEAL